MVMKIIKWFFIIAVIIIFGFYIRNKIIGPIGWAIDDVEKVLRDNYPLMVIKSKYIVESKAQDGSRFIHVCGIADVEGGYNSWVRFASHSRYDETFKTFDTISVEVEDIEKARIAERNNMLSAFQKVYWNKWCVDSNHPPLESFKMKR